MQRRHFLQAFGAAGWIAATGRVAAQTFSADPFTLGVASGSPSADGFVLWTRLMAAPGGAPLPDLPIEVRWELALDQGFRRMVQSGSTLAEPAYAHSVHVEVRGMGVRGAVARYWYRFQTGGAISPIGRTNTMAPRDSAAPLRLALTSCQHWEHGYFAAHRHLAADDLDLVVFVGDYIYEHGIGQNRPRLHNSPACHTLADYRARYAQYHSDPDLQAAHAAVPWIVTWDDHEVENDYANDLSNSLRGTLFLARRAVAYRAYWEHMPLPRAMLPVGPMMRIYQRYQWGALATLHMVDARQYRDHQACMGGNGGSAIVHIPTCAERLDPQRSLLGWTQERWLADGLKRHDQIGHWQLIGQQSMMAEALYAAPRAASPAALEHVWNDSWDGYPVARGRLLRQAQALRHGNLVVLGGDIHASYVTDLKPDFNDPKSPVVATEFVGTSITSRSWPQARTEQLMRDNPHLKFGKSDARGYTRIALTPRSVTTTFNVLDDATRSDAAISTAAVWVVETGKAGAVRA